MLKNSFGTESLHIGNLHHVIMLAKKTGRLSPNALDMPSPSEPPRRWASCTSSRRTACNITHAPFLMVSHGNLLIIINSHI